MIQIYDRIFTSIFYSVLRYWTRNNSPWSITVRTPRIFPTLPDPSSTTTGWWNARKQQHIFPWVSRSVNGILSQFSWVALCKLIIHFCMCVSLSNPYTHTHTQRFFFSCYSTAFLILRDEVLHSLPLGCLPLPLIVILYLFLRPQVSFSLS